MTTVAVIMATMSLQAQTDIAAARAEYAEKSGQTTAAPAVNTSQPSTARIYRIDGTPVSNTTHGIVIEDGQKRLIP